MVEITSRELKAVLVMFQRVARSPVDPAAMMAEVKNLTPVQLQFARLILSEDIQHRLDAVCSLIVFAKRSEDLDLPAIDAMVTHATKENK